MSEEIYSAMIDIHCKELKMPGLRKAYAALAREAIDKNHSALQFLSACLSEEATSRQQNRLLTYTRQAKFPAQKTLQDFDFSAIPALPKAKIVGLAEGQFIRDKENVVCMGGSGTGKTHMSIALGMAAITAGYRVRFISVMQLIQELLQAESEYRLPRYLRTWDKFDLVILDELGYVSLEQGGPLLFQFCAHRYEKGSLLITTNLEFARWTDVFHDATLTTALLDRLTHHSHILLFEGESFRFRESQSRQQMTVSGVEQ
ncbi:IS21-like element helper ATPase IstB [Alicyclobacillus sp. SO9]|uniref:IS21-like element helper ATPase IstB n=1 Tax=Alicyclobacillus sp. SO9 TaxID=2665646 RepID=UPI0018E79F84|nr:IS21-like element helper ATPase IstB [Alicyclobacillus sp. SO9]QQE81540.1 IS21-like element helper ATPase IstB [Alicyclobacillus sp. SO9]